MLREHDDLEFAVVDGRLRIWTKVRDVDGVSIKDVVLGPSTATAQADLDDLGLARLFETPKPVALLQLLVAATTGPDDLVIDLFAGSASTAHAVVAQNEADGGRRRSISVNTAEPTALRSQARMAGFETVSQIGIERLRRVLASRTDQGTVRLMQCLPTDDSPVE